MDHRYGKRTDADLPVVVRMKTGDQLFGMIKNIGSQGMFVESPGVKPFGRNAVLEVCLAGGAGHKEDCVYGMVVHVDGSGAGLTFEGSAQRLKERVRSAAGHAVLGRAARLEVAMVTN